MKADSISWPPQPCNDCVMKVHKGLDRARRTGRAHNLTIHAYCKHHQVTICAIVTRGVSALWNLQGPQSEAEAYAMFKFIDSGEFADAVRSAHEPRS